MYAKPKTFADRGTASRRAETSKRLVELTFRELLSRKPFAEITMKDLADGAGIARSTVYRRWAGLEQLVWEMIRPDFEKAVRSAFGGEITAAADQLMSLWEVRGLLFSLHDATVADAVRRHISSIIAAEIERRSSGRDTETCSLLLATSVLAFMIEFPCREQVRRAQLEELMFILYVSAFMTPSALRAAARDRTLAKAGRFPPAVSVRESLASDDYIISMIDGRPYRSLTRHISRYGMTPAEYRRCFHLADDYPMTAKRYSERRSEIAKQVFARKSDARVLEGSSV